MGTRRKAPGWAISLTALTACAGHSGTGPEPTTVRLDADSELVLSVGDDVVVSGTTLRIAVREVANDSRCPIDAYCVWAGDAEIVLALSVGTGTSVSEVLHLNDEGGPSEIVWTDYHVTLVALEPSARGGVSIRQEDYRIRLRIEWA